MSGSVDRTLKVWNASSGQCLRTLSGHTASVRRRRPVEPCVNCSSTPRGAQVSCVVVLPNGSIVSGSGWPENTLKVWEDVEGKMAHEVALHRTQKNFAGRLVAAFL